MKKIIVFSLWGDKEMYWKGAVENIKLAKTYYPDFTCRFYVDSSQKELAKKLESSNNTEIVFLKDEKSLKFPDERFTHTGLFWRFLPLKDNDIEILLSRDCDSRISFRESKAVEEWLKTDKNFHIMRDHPYHQVPILAGMWGCRNNILSNIDEYLINWGNHTKGRYQAEDQDFLGQIIYPLVKNTSMEHSEFNISYGNNIKNFPTIRENYEFVGDVFDENNVRHPDYWKIIKNNT